MTNISILRFVFLQREKSWIALRYSLMAGIFRPDFYRWYRFVVNLAIMHFLKYLFCHGQKSGLCDAANAC
jgi:hypothetical protein